MDSSPNLRNMVNPVMVNAVIEHHACLFAKSEWQIFIVEVMPDLNKC